MSKKSRFRGCFDKQYGKLVQALLKSASQQPFRIHWSLATKFCSKKSFLLTCEILRHLVKTLDTDEKYLVLNKYNLRIPIQIQISQKQKGFSQFFAAFLKFTLNFEYFEQKDDPHSFCISEITESEKVVR